MPLLITGLYSGVLGDAEIGTPVERGVSTTFLRGAQMIDEEGVVEFDALAAGHYLSQATHEHVVVYLNGTVIPNDTYTGGTVAPILAGCT